MIWSVRKRTGRPVFMVSHLDLKGTFPGLTVPILVASPDLRRVLKAKTVIRINKAGGYDEKFIQKIPTTGDVEIIGCFCSYKYSWPFRDQLKKELIFNDRLRANANRILRSAQSKLLGDDNVKSIRFVAVHVRRTDFLFKRDYEKGHRVPEPSYYHKAMAMFRNISSEQVLFIVTGDDIPWAQKNLQSNDTFVSTGGSPAGDMALLASCNDTIYGAGTYGWWIAFFTPGRKVYFRDAFVNGSFFSHQHPFNDTFPPDWIGLGN